MRRLIALAALVVVVGCAPPEDDAANTGTIPLRNATAPIGSQTDVQASDLNGSWVVRRRVAGAPLGEARSLVLTALGSQVILDAICSDPTVTDCADAPEEAVYLAAGEGRWRLAAATSEGPPQGFDSRSYPTDIWVLWADISRRTVALGDPGGTYAVVIDREATGGDDRIVAAGEILDWYGFDHRRLENPQ